MIYRFLNPSIPQHKEHSQGWGEPSTKREAILALIFRAVSEHWMSFLFCISLQLTSLQSCWECAMALQHWAGTGHSKGITFGMLGWDTSHRGSYSRKTRSFLPQTQCHWVLRGNNCWSFILPRFPALWLSRRGAGVIPAEGNDPSPLPRRICWRSCWYL